jgi:NADH-quinone oxidoreductase subunit L
MGPVWLIPAAPLAGAVILLAAGKRLGRAAGPLACGAVAVGFIATVSSLFDLVGAPAGSRSTVTTLFEWASSGRLHIDIALRWDPLSALMCMVITGVGFLIHVYSIGYMHDDPRYARFFAYLNLFVFSMLVLVLGDNLLVLFAGWEGVGLCSYLLIGFWFERPKAATAAKKAFLTTRIGDVGMMIGIFLVFATLGSLDIPALNRAAADGHLARTTATAIALLLFAGAVGKSAQIPLYVWLPDAMEGPTPVSALIHAATMVTAGVYLVVRLNPLYELAAVAGTVVAVIGAATALYAAVLAMAEDDIKRVLAYSTVSQLGFMFLAAGLGAGDAAMFHLVTHAFFKALLFLAAGSVMHGLGGETALDRMGGLRRAMPWTFAVTFAGWAAITGVLPFSGFFSKDAILSVAWAEGRTALFFVATAAAGLTAFYMTRLLALAFAGQSRWSEGTRPHESPPAMVWPMAVLAVLAAVGGVLNLPSVFPKSMLLSHFLAPVVGASEHHESIGVIFVVWAVAAIGALSAWWIYGVDLERRVAVRRRLGPVNTLVRNKFFVDEIYATLIVAPARLVAAFCAFVVDRRIIDGAVNGLAGAVSLAARSWRQMQTGYVRNYAAAFAGGAAAITLYFALRMGV